MPVPRATSLNSEGLLECLEAGNHNFCRSQGWKRLGSFTADETRDFMVEELNPPNLETNQVSPTENASNSRAEKEGLGDYGRS